LLRLASPGLLVSTLAPAAAESEFDDIFTKALFIEICGHSTSIYQPAGDAGSPRPDRERAHDCLSCCSSTSPAGIVPPSINVSAPSDVEVASSIAPRARGAPSSVYAVRQRGPPLA
jgi:hypothetical protein